IPATIRGAPHPKTITPRDHPTSECAGPECLRRGAIKSLLDFENRRKIFEIDATYKFCLLSLVGRASRESTASFAFFLEDITDLDDSTRVFTLRPDEITGINPNTGTLPIFRTRKDADLTLAIHGRLPVLWDETKVNGNIWRITFKNLFNMTDDSDLFQTKEELEAKGATLHGNVFTLGSERFSPVYEGKMIYHFDHRWNSYYGTGNEDRRKLSHLEKQQAAVAATPRYWVAEDGLIPTVRRNVETEIPGAAVRLAELNWRRNWLCGWRDVTKAVNERTAVPAFLPKVAAGHTLPLMFPQVSAALTCGLIAAQSSLIFDYVSRQKSDGRHMALMTWKQLPVPAPESLEPHIVFIAPRVLELVYCTYDMVGLAQDLEDYGEPFHWDDGRRARIRAELDAYFFHLYGINRSDADYIQESFQSETGGLKNNEIAKYGTYRTKNLVLAEYDRMAAAGVSLENPLIDGENFVSTLTPAPGHGPRHPARGEMRVDRES
ncbi:hypothetical protein AB0I38_39980, partial [Nonomuraea cavernae]